MKENKQIQWLNYAKKTSISFFKYTLYLDKSEKVVENKLGRWKPKKNLNTK